MTVDEGRKAYRLERGQLEPGEELPTATKLQRGRLAQRAKAGDVAARRALAQWTREKNNRLREELDAWTRGHSDG